MDEPLLSVGALHALAYCERLFYLEEVERIRIADAAVYAGRRLHVELSQEEEGEWQRPYLTSCELGIHGQVDVLRRRDGQLIPYEHKRGRSAGGPGAREAWRTDRIQGGAYAMLVEATYGVPVHEVRVRYHADRLTVRVPMDESLRVEVQAAVRRARELRQSTVRPPLASNERLCRRCSLAPACFPDEVPFDANATDSLRTLPAHPHGLTLHVTVPGAQLTKSGFQLVVKATDGASERWPIEEIGTVVLHGMAQITTQAIRLCVERGVGVHWVTALGRPVSS